VKFSGSALEGFGEPGFIIAKITKNSKDYYFVNTQLSSSSNTARLAQLSQIATALNSLPIGARVIFGGDLSSGLDPDAKDPSYANSGFYSYDPSLIIGGPTGNSLMSMQTNTAYYAYSRDARKNFYGSLTEVMNVDWVVPLLKRPNGSGSFTAPTSYRWWVHPVRYVPFAYADLSDHFAVTTVLNY
jgi:hypothetical protein